MRCRAYAHWPLERRPGTGAGGRLAAQQLRGAPASQNVLLMANPAVMLVAPLVFKDAGYHLLLVANKFQTGFDQPLLCGMYVDKRLAQTPLISSRRIKNDVPIEL